MRKNNLTPWQAGVSGNPNGRPKGSRNIKNVIIDMLNDPRIYDLLPNKQYGDKGTPLTAIIATLMTKALDGDVRAADVLLKYVVPRDIPAEIKGGFFSSEKMIITIVGEGQDDDLHPEDSPLPTKEPEQVTAESAEQRVSF